MHSRLCREFRVVKATVISSKTEHKNINSRTPSVLSKTRCLHAIQQRKRAIYWWYSVALYQLSWSQLRSLSTKESSLPAQSLRLICFPRTSTFTPPFSWLNLLRHLLKKLFQNSSLVISSPHTFPLFQCPVQTFYACTGNHPEHLGTGSSRWKLQFLCMRCDHCSSFCCEDFSTQQALHCIDFGCVRGVGAMEHFVLVFSSPLW